MRSVINAAMYHVLIYNMCTVGKNSLGLVLEIVIGRVQIPSVIFLFMVVLGFGL